MRTLLRAFITIALSCISLHAFSYYNCSTLEAFSNFTKTNYTSGSVAHNKSGVFSCDVPDWCNMVNIDTGENLEDESDDVVLGHVLPFIPGEGWAWTHAWTQIGYCECKIERLQNGGYSLCDYVLRTGESSALSSNYNLFSSARAQLTINPFYIEQYPIPGDRYNPSNVKRVEKIVSQVKWEQLFPLANTVYSYNNFLKSVALFPRFCDTYHLQSAGTPEEQEARDAIHSEKLCRKSLATLFAHIAFESGANDTTRSEPLWRQGLYYANQKSCTETGAGCEYNSECSSTNITRTIWPCGKNSQNQYVKYFARGAIPLQYSYNYAQFSEAIYKDPKKLLSSPHQVSESWLNIATAIYTFLKPQTPGPNMKHLVDGTWQPNQFDTESGIVPGFSATINLKHSSSACGTGTETTKAKRLIDNYKRLSIELNNSITGENLTCKNMKSFSTRGNALPQYWDKSFFENPDYPERKAFTCLLVPYITPFSIFDQPEGGSAVEYDGYKNCVINHYDVRKIITQY